MAIKIEYAINESLTNMKRNLFMSFAAVLVVTISLALLGAVAITRAVAARTADMATRQVRVTVFLTKDLPAADRDEIDADLRAMPEVRTVLYESQEEAYIRFQELFKTEPNIVRNTRPDALPESFRVQLWNPTTFEIVADSFAGRPGVESVRDERDYVNKLFAETRSMRTLGLIIAIAVGIAALVLIATTIRMAIYARRREIGIMKLVGATNWFIRVPFMMEGVVQGIAGAVVGLALIAGGVGIANLTDNDTNPSNLLSLTDVIGRITWSDIALHGALMLAVGIFVGAVGSLVGLRKFLDV